MSDNKRIGRQSTCSLLAAVRHRPLHWLGEDPVNPLSHWQKKNMSELITRQF